MNALVEFYAGRGTDGAGRSLALIREQSFDWLERTHDYIQWLFPLPEPSRANPSAPVLDTETAEAFRRDHQLRGELLCSFELMLAFYGFDCDLLEPDIPDVWEGPDFPNRSRNWLTPGNHNHLRISRILRSLRILGFEECSAAWFEVLDRLYRTRARHLVDVVTYRHWRMAAGLDGHSY